MNAPFSLPVIPAPESFDRAHAEGEIGAALSMLTHASHALSMGAWHLERAVAKGAGASPDLIQLEDVASRLAEASLKVEAATARLTAKVGDR